MAGEGVPATPVTHGARTDTGNCGEFIKGNADLAQFVAEGVAVHPLVSGGRPVSEVARIWDSNLKCRDLRFEHAGECVAASRQPVGRLSGFDDSQKSPRTV